MDVIKPGKFKILPAKPGTCAMCATKHDKMHAHNLQSLFYGVRFKMKYGRDPTWADAIAHLPEIWRDRWKETMESGGFEFTIPDGEPIAEPYAESDPFRSEQ